MSDEPKQIIQHPGVAFAQELTRVTKLLREDKIAFAQDILDQFHSEHVPPDGDRRVIEKVDGGYSLAVDRQIYYDREGNQVSGDLCFVCETEFEMAQFVLSEYPSIWK